MGSAQALTFGQLLKRYRLSARLSQEALAERSGLAVRSISDLERDVRQLPHPDTIQRLAAALRLSTQDHATLAATARRRGGLTPAPSPEDAPVSALTPFVGRDGEMEHVARVLAGQDPPVLLFGGEPGIGKSRLLHEAAERARASGWRVLTGRCTRRSGQASYAPLTGALAHAIAYTALEQQRLDLQGCAWLSRLLPELDQRMLAPAPSWTLPPEQERRLLFAAVSRYLANVAGPSGTLLLLDDLQWASDDALDLLESIARDAAEAVGAPLRVVGAYRDTEAPLGSALSVLLADLARDGLAAQHSVRPLDHHEALLLADLLLITSRDMTPVQAQDRAPAALATHSSSDQSALARQLVQRAGGVPFFLESCAIGWRLDASDAVDEGYKGDTADAVGPPNQLSPDTAPEQPQIPWRVMASIRQRVAALPLDVQQLVSALAVVGRSAPFALLAMVLGRTERRLVRAVEAACQARVLEEARSETTRLATYQFTHDLIRETIAQDLSAARRVVLHRALGDALETLDAAARRPAELAYHFAEAGDHARALPYALLAGDQAEAIYAHAEAEGQYRIAVDLAQAVDDRAREAAALEKLGDAVKVLGRHGEAADLCERALRAYQALGDQLGELRALSGLLHAHAEVGREKLDEAVALARTILARIDPQNITAITPRLGSGLAAAHSNLGWILWTSGQYEDAQADYRQAIDLARAAGDEAELAQAQFRLLIAGGLEKTPEAFENTLALAERSGQMQIVVTSHNMAAWMYAEQGDFARALEHMEQSIVAAERRQDPRHLAWQLHNVSHFLLHCGDWQRMRDLFARAESIMRETDRHGATWQSVEMANFRGRLAVMEGGAEDARRRLEEAMARSAQMRGALSLLDPTCLLAEADLLAGDAEQARRRLTSLLDDPNAPPAVSSSPELLLFLAWAELALGNYEDAEARLNALLADAPPIFSVDVLPIRGMLATLQRRWSVATAALDEALASARVMPYPYAELKALWMYGQLETARGNPAEAREHFEAALAICDRLGEGLYRKYIDRDLLRVAHTA